jgi:hypothetical protein
MHDDDGIEISVVDLSNPEALAGLQSAAALAAIECERMKIGRPAPIVGGDATRLVNLRYQRP